MATSPSWLARTRLPRGGGGASMRREHDPDVVEGYLRDAARYPGGHSEEICFPAGEADVVALLAEARPLLVVGAQSSLTGGATPHGERVVSTSRLREIHDWRENSVRCGAGVVLRDLEAACEQRGVYFPPVPTYDGATVGGVVSTDAAGAATFKHGTTRAWVEELTVVLACGEVLDVVRGATTAHPEGWFEIETLSRGRLRVPVPVVASPAVPKVSAGYRGGAGLDLIDLFIGSEGTLGVIVDVQFRVVAPRPSWFAALIPVADDAEAVSLTTELREHAARLHRSDARFRGGVGDAGWDADFARQGDVKGVLDGGNLESALDGDDVEGVLDGGNLESALDGDDVEGVLEGADVAAIEYMDARCLEILREDGVPARVGVTLPAEAGALLLVQVELPPAYDRARAQEELASYADRAASGPLVSFCRILDRRGLLGAAVPALPGEDDRRRALFALREAVPEGVNARVRDAALRSIDPVSKSGGDVIVPFDRFEEALARYRSVLAAASLDSAVWGHISDGNVHPNLIAADGAGMQRARAAQVAIGQISIELGGSPLAEHGTGRNPGKKLLLAVLHGADGVASMRATKRSLDPAGLLAPGVLFDPT